MAKAKKEYVYIKNNRKYAVSYVLKADNGLERTIIFDCFRQYRDTGNVYSTGITEVSVADYEELKQNKVFALALSKGWLSESEESAVAVSEKSANALATENEALKARIAEMESNNGSDKEAEEKAKALADENASLKAQLEALKATKDKSEDKESF